MAQRAFALCRTDQASSAARDRLALRTDDIRSADRALRRLLHPVDVRRTLFLQRAHNLGNDITGAADDHLIADAHILALDLVHVVQRGIGHGDPADKHRGQPRHRGQCPGAPDLEFHIQQAGAGLFGRKLVRNRPARRAGYLTQRLAQRQVIDLVNHAVNLERQLGAHGLQGCVAVQTGINVLGWLIQLRHRQPPGSELLKQRGMSGRQPETLNIAEGIAHDSQRPLGGDRRVQLP